ncbi:hypothetical protein GGS21DRAFT_432281 [Xylaria nigripes]|nr:hypothetical protein GGS21DRAFT_432281 [Xylaria nigripes]
MAGHIFSRYMSSLWSALFAPFHLPLFTRIWHFFSQILALENEHIASLPSPNPASPSSPTTFRSSPAASPFTLPATKSAESTEATAYPVPPAVLHPNLPAQNSSHWITGDRPLNLILPHDNPDCGGQNTDTHCTVNLLSEDHSQDQQQDQREESIDMTKKRTGRGRGAKSSIHPPMTVTPAIPVTPATDTVQVRPASASQSEHNASGHTSFTPGHANCPKLTSFGRGDSWARNCTSPIAQQQPVDHLKENVAPDQDNEPASPATLTESQETMPLAVIDNRSEPQKPGTRSHPTVGPPSTVAAMDTMNDRSPKSSFDSEQLHVLTDRLTLDDASSPQVRAQQTLNEAVATAEASAFPAPLVVAVPVPPQLQAEQPRPETPPPPILPGLIEPTTDEERAEREYHLRYMREALDMGDLALKTNETPVGCVLVYQGRVIAKGMNATNVTRNGTRHAEFMALSALLSRRELGDAPVSKTFLDPNDASWSDVDPKDGHIYPYGQKLHPAPVVDRSIVSECVLYVTVEPCIMCASLLRQLGIKKVYFGAVNDKFGGTGGVFRVHMNSKPVTLPKGRPYQQGYGPQDLNLISKGRAVALPRDDDDGDGGNVEPGFPVEGGYLRDDAVSLLRRFYVQENGRAPQPRKKEGRAARLYAAMENQNRTVNASDLSDNAPETPVEAETPMILGSKSDSTINIVCI